MRQSKLAEQIFLFVKPQLDMYEIEESKQESSAENRLTLRSINNSPIEKKGVQDEPIEIQAQTK